MVCFKTSGIRVIECLSESVRARVLCMCVWGLKALPSERSYGAFRKLGYLILGSI